MFYKYLDHFIIIYLDNILVYLKDQEKHNEYIKLILEKLREVNLYTKLEKHEFNKQQVEFLKYLVIVEEIKMDSSKVKTIHTWTILKSVCNI